MDSQASSKLVSFRARDGTLLPCPEEWEPCRLELFVPSDAWRETQVSIQGEPRDVYLVRSESGDQICADWPRSNAGHYGLEITWPGGKHRETVTISPRKLTPQSFSQMLDDLEQELPADIAIALQHGGALAGINLPAAHENTIAGEIVRLRRALFGTEDRLGLLNVLHRIARNPHHVLHTVGLWVPRWRAQRPHPVGLRQAIAQPHNRAADNLPNRVHDQHVEHTCDVYENRILKLYVRQVDLRLRRARRAVQYAGQAEIEQELRELMFHLRGAVNSSGFLQDVSPLTSAPTHVSMVMQNRPEYRAMFKGFLELQRSPFIRIEHPGLSAPLNNVPALYQTWGTSIVLKELVETATSYGYRVRDQQLVRRDASGFFIEILPKNRAAIDLVHPDKRTRIRAFPERSFGASGKVHSVSYSQRPDLVIEIVDESQRRRLLVFDPKYKLREEMNEEAENELPRQERVLRPLKTDIDKMHTYRDALRDSAGRRVVEFASTLYPGVTQMFGNDIGALGAVPGGVGKLQESLEDIFGRFLFADG